MIKVTVLGIKNGQVRLGFEADADVPVHRLEVWERICDETGFSRFAILNRLLTPQPVALNKPQPAPAPAIRRLDIRTHAGWSLPAAPSCMALRAM